MNQLRKRIIFLFFILAFFGALAGCHQLADEMKYKTAAKQPAIDHMKEKYNIELTKKDIESINVLKAEGTIFAGPYINVVYVKFKDGYTVCVEDSGDRTYDDMEIPNVKKDIEKEFTKNNPISKDYYIDEIFLTSLHYDEHEFLPKDAKYDGNLMDFLKNRSYLTLELSINWKSEDDSKDYIEVNKNFVNSFKPYFKGVHTNIESYVFKNEYYFEQIKKKPFHKDTDYSAYPFGDYGAYSTLHVINCFTTYYNDDWKDGGYYDKFIKIDEGLEVSSTNIVFSSQKDIYYEKVKCGDRNKQDLIYTFDGNIEEKLPNPWITSDVLPVTDGDGNINDFKLDTYLYFISNTAEDIRKYDLDWCSTIYVKINKNTFADGKLKKGYKLIVPVLSDDGIYRLIGESYDDAHYPYEDDNYIYISKENRGPIALTKDPTP